MKVEDIVQKLIDGETVYRKHFTANKISLIEFRLKQIQRNCSTVLRQLKELKK